MKLQEGNLPACESCVRRKLTQRPFPKESFRKTEMLDLVHTDLSGPMCTESMGGGRYFMMFVEDSTRWTEVKFLKSKNQALDAFKSYKNLVETQTGRKIKCVQSDNGTEYCNNSFNEFPDNCGIKRRLTFNS